MKKKPEHKIVKQHLPDGTTAEIIIPNPDVFVWEKEQRERA